MSATMMKLKNAVEMQCSPLVPSAVASIKWATTMVNDDSEVVHHDLDKEQAKLL